MFLCVLRISRTTAESESCTNVTTSFAEWKQLINIYYVTSYWKQLIPSPILHINFFKKAKTFWSESKNFHLPFLSDILKYAIKYIYGNTFYVYFKKIHLRLRRYTKCESLHLNVWALVKARLGHLNWTTVLVPVTSAWRVAICPVFSWSLFDQLLVDLTYQTSNQQVSKRQVNSRSNSENKDNFTVLNILYDLTLYFCNPLTVFFPAFLYTLRGVNMQE